jgi:hypothetical protein
MRRAIASMHDGLRARVRVEGVLSDEFEMVHGVRQGCVMAPILFKLFFAFAVHRAEERLRATRGENFGVQIVHRKRGGGKRVVKETSAFDPRSYKSVQSAGKRSNFWVALATQKEEELQPMMDAFVEATSAFGLTSQYPRQKCWPLSQTSR